MSEFLNIEDAVLSNKQVLKKKESPIIYALILALSIGVGIYSTKMDNNENLGFALLFLSIVLAIIALKGLLIPRKILIYTPTGEKIQKNEFYYDTNEKKEVYDCVRNKGFEMLNQLPKGKSNGIRVVYFKTHSNSFSLVQVHEYVPYEYVPTMEAI